MSKTVFLHIGAHKTGTTALQHTATRHRAALAAQGLDYPKVCWTGVAHHLLPMALQGVAPTRVAHVPSSEEAVGALAEAVAGSPCPRVLISSEALLKTPEAALTPLARALSPFDVRILVTLRRPDDMYLSSYQQRAKDPFDGFDAELRTYLQTPWRVSRDTRYFQHLTGWAAQFGLEAVTVVQYEVGNPVLAVLEAAGGHVPLSSDPAARNASGSARLCALMLWTKRRGLPLWARRAVYSVANRLLRGGPGLHLSTEDRRVILQATEPEAKAAFRLFGLENPYPASLADAAPTRRGAASQL